MNPRLSSRPDLARYLDALRPHGRHLWGERSWLYRRGWTMNYARQDALNRQLGHMGGRFAVDVERHGL